MKNILAEYSKCLHNRTFIVSTGFSIIMLVFAFIINFYSVTYTNATVSNSVTDVILSNTPVYDLDGFFVNGAIGLVIFITLVCLWDPRRMPFTVKTIAVFVIVRSVFITLTHVGPFPIHATIAPESQAYIKDLIGQKLFSSFFLGNDFFFSGHTGLPFLLAFLYYDKKWLRIIFILLSVFFGVVVLFAHLHYTIDVLSAFFISYGVYRISRILFKEELPPELEDRALIV